MNVRGFTFGGPKYLKPNLGKRKLEDYGHMGAGGKPVAKV
jgi:hypothetical protein